MTLESIVFAHPINLLSALRTGCAKLAVASTQKISVPEEVTWGVDGDTYDAYRRGLDSACADIVVTTRLPNGTPAVVATQRKIGSCFGGCWWMQGGAVHAYRGYEDFVAERAEKECGVRPQVEALMGVGRTCADAKKDGGVVASTTNLCYVGFAPYEAIEKNLKADEDHTGLQLLTLADLDALPEEERHPYADFFFRLALLSMLED